MVAHTSSPSTQKVGAGLLRVKGQLELLNETLFQNSAIGPETWVRVQEPPLLLQRTQVWFPALDWVAFNNL